jgi:hypothetical protein
MRSGDSQNVGDLLTNITSNIVVQKTVLSATIISGLTTALDIAPKLVGLIAALLGLSVTILIRKNTLLARKKMKLEIELLEKKKGEDELAD